MIVTYISMASRGILSEVYKWANQRKAFGRSLLNQPVVRQRLAKMSAECEAVTAWHESMTYQMCNMEAHEQGEKLAAKCSLLKFYSTRVAQEISDDAVNMFGGRAITQGQAFYFIFFPFSFLLLLSLKLTTKIQWHGSSCGTLQSHV